MTNKYIYRIYGKICLLNQHLVLTEWLINLAILAVLFLSYKLYMLCLCDFNIHCYCEKITNSQKSHLSRNICKPHRKWIEKKFSSGSNLLNWPFFETFFMLYFIPYSCSIMTFSFVLFTYQCLHLFLYHSISFSHSLFVSFSISSSFTFPKALVFLSPSLSVSVSYTLLFLPSSCSSPEAFLFFSFFFSFYGCDRKSSCHTADWFRSSHPDCVFSELWPHDCKSAPLLTVWPPLKSLGSLKGISGSSLEDFCFK